MSFIDKIHKLFNCKCEKCCANGNCKCENKKEVPVTMTETPTEAPAQQ
jgi:hypothetical protein